MINDDHYHDAFSNIIINYIHITKIEMIICKNNNKINNM